MTGVLVFAIFTLSLLVIGAYSIVSPWWTTRAGKAYMYLFASLALLAGHFLVEAIEGESPDWVEDIVLGLVALAIAWNGYTIVSKQIHYWRKAHPRNREGAAIDSNPIDPSI